MISLTCVFPSCRYQQHQERFMKEVEENLARPVNSISQPDCQGFLCKFNDKCTSWKNCYLVLKDASLYIYEDRNDQRALGEFTARWHHMCMICCSRQAAEGLSALHVSPRRMSSRVRSCTYVTKMRLARLHPLMPSSNFRSILASRLPSPKLVDNGQEKHI